MMYIGDLLNKIRWDKKIKPEEYTIVYFDRIAERAFEIPFTELGRRGGFFFLKFDGKEVNFPLHRIRKVKRNGKVIWERE